MPIEYLAPGVYVEEIPAGARPIEGVGTSTAGFVGAYLVGSHLRTPTSDGDAFDARRLLEAWERMRSATYAPAWTDRNASDAGVTLLDLLAYAADAMLLWPGAKPPEAIAAAARLAAASLALVTSRSAAAYGVVAGLEVVGGEDGALRVVPGIAIDPLGRTIDPEGGCRDARSDTAVRRKPDP